MNTLSSVLIEEKQHMDTGGENQLDVDVAVSKGKIIEPSVVTEEGLASVKYLRESVMLPDGEDLLEWYAANIVDLFSEVVLLYDLCTEDAERFKEKGEGFPPGVEYRWPNNSAFSLDDEEMDLESISILSPGHCSSSSAFSFTSTVSTVSMLSETQSGACASQALQEQQSASEEQHSSLVMETQDQYSAPEYVEAVLDWIGETIEKWPEPDERTFSSSFRAQVRIIMKLMFTVFAIMYASHYQVFQSLDALDQLNLTFKRFVFFSLEFDLLNEYITRPLHHLVEHIKQEYQSHTHHSLQTVS